MHKCILLWCKCVFRITSTKELRCGLKIEYCSVDIRYLTINSGINRISDYVVTWQMSRCCSVSVFFCNSSSWHYFEDVSRWSVFFNKNHNSKWDELLEIVVKLALNTKKYRQDHISHIKAFNNRRCSAVFKINLKFYTLSAHLRFPATSYLISTFDVAK